MLPGVPHLYRIAIQDAEFYEFYCEKLEDERKLKSMQLNVTDSRACSPEKAMSSNHSLSLSPATSEVDVLIYEVADKDCQRRDRSIPRGNNGANYEGTGTHFPSLPTYLHTPDSLSYYERIGRKFAAELAGIRVPECDTRSISRRKQSRDRSRRISEILAGIPRRDDGRARHLETFRRARIMEEEMLALLALVFKEETKDLLGRIKRKLFPRVIYPRKSTIYNAPAIAFRFRARDPARSCSLPARASGLRGESAAAFFTREDGG